MPAAPLPKRPAPPVKLPAICEGAAKAIDAKVLAEPRKLGAALAPSAKMLQLGGAKHGISVANSVFTRSY